MSLHVACCAIYGRKLDVEDEDEIPEDVEFDCFYTPDGPQAYFEVYGSVELNWDAEEVWSELPKPPEDAPDDCRWYFGLQVA